MNTILVQATPTQRAAIYGAAAIIFKLGPMHRVEVYTRMDFGPVKTHESKLQSAFDTDWLRQGPDGRIELTDYSKRHFERKAAKAAITGQVTPPQYRANVFASQGISKKNIPNRRGPRADVPAWSVREAVSIKTIGGSDA